MVGKSFELNERSLSFVEEIGRHMPGGFFIYQARQPEELLYANKACLDIFGCADTEEFKALTGFTFRGMVHPEDYKRIASSIDEQIKISEDNLDYVEYRIIRRDGAVRWVDDYGHYAETKAYGGIYYVFISDITEKREKQERDNQIRDAVIHTLTNFYNTVWLINDIETESCSLYHTDLDEIHARAIHNALSHAKYTDTKTEYVTTMVAEEDQDRMQEEISLPYILQQFRHRDRFSVTFRRALESGTRYYRIDFGKVRMPEGKTGVTMGFLDVDVETRETLAKNHALSEALAAAEQANKAKTAFLSNMSHEIRTPMNAIIGLDSLALRKETLDAETREYLERIGDSARHLLGLINDILDMSRIESGRMILRKEEFSFRNMLEQINTMVMSQCTEKGLNYECAMTGGVSDYYIGDDMKLKQVLINILSNAVKFTDAPGSVRLSVERTASFGDQSTLRFSVRDTGIGMDKSFIPKIFDSFTQEDSSRSSKYGSAGLGMAITKNIVELMNGTISVQSEKGVGTEFTVVISLTNSSRKGSVTSHLNPKEMRVLVVDDEQIAAEHARIVMDEAGIKADTCYGGEEALRLLELQHTKHEPYNLVLLDWKMPGMDGIEVAREIRRKYDRETTVIILTAFNWDEIMDEALHAGVDSFLAKPLFASNVIDMFERIARRNNMSLYKEKKRADLKGRHILMAEDVLINAEIMKQIVMMREAEIDHAENGQIAVDMFAQSEIGWYDAILMDVRMPEMDGLEAAATIRSLNRADAKTVPIIALTANAFDEDVQRSLQVGMNAHLSKPVEPEHLYQTLEELIWEADRAKDVEE